MAQREVEPKSIFWRSFRKENDRPSRKAVWDIVGKSQQNKSLTKNTFLSQTHTHVTDKQQQSHYDSDKHWVMKGDK